MVSGVLVFVAGQAVLRFALEPIQQQRKVIGEIAFVLLMYANVTDDRAYEQQSGHKLAEHTPVPEAMKVLRRLASELQASLYTVPAYSFWSVLGIVPDAKRVQKASSSLVGWSNSLYSGRTSEHRESVATNLSLSR